MKRQEFDKFRLATAIKDCYKDPLTAAEAGVSIFETLYAQGFKTLGQVTKFVKGGQEWLKDQKRQARRKTRRNRK